MITFISAGLGFVAALFWQNAIKDTISAFIPPSEGWQYELAVAILVTFLAVVVLYTLTKLTTVNEKTKQETKKQKRN